MIWDLTETIDPKILQGHDGAVVALDVSASGCHTVVSGSCDRTLKLWELRMVNCSGRSRVTRIG